MKIIPLCLTLGSLILLTACGGSGGSGDSQPVVQESALDKALRSGDVRPIKDEALLLDAALSDINAQVGHFDGIKRSLFGSGSSGLSQLSWNPSHDSSLIASQYPFNDVVLYSNSSWQEGNEVHQLPLAVAGSRSQVSENSRYLVFGGNPLRTSHNESFDQFLNNAMHWLSGVTGSTQRPLRVVISQLDQSYYFPDRSAVRSWFDDHYQGEVSYNEASSCNGAALAGCLEQAPDILLVSQHLRNDAELAPAQAAIKQALQRGIPLLYVHHNGDHKPLGKAIFELLNVGFNKDNYWSRLGLTDFNPQSLLGRLPDNMTAIKTLLSNFKTADFNVDLTACEVRSCPPDSGLESAFSAGASAVKAMFNQYDARQFRLFDQSLSAYRLPKLLILLADYYRREVRYPMDKNTTDTLAFLQSFYADHAVYNSRDLNPVQPDMGNFSRSDFSHITPENVNVTLTAKPYFRSAGVYAIPGVTMTVSRKDNAAVSTHVFINTLRTGATHIFSDNQYNRPYYLKSQAIEIKPGDTFRFTSSYGGPVQIGFDQKDVDVEFEFKQVGRHPHWRDKNDDADFAARMAAAEYDWAEIATAGFEVHSRLPKLNASLQDSIWPLASDFANATMRYTHNKVHVLAGFQGPGIDKVGEIHDFIAQRGLAIDTIDIVKHMNADQPTCGWGCSGNPYDAGWNFSPVGHGDIHELGHGIERSEMRFEGYGGHSNTNFYSYYAKSIYEEETGESASCQALPFKELFEVLQQSKKADNAFDYVAAQRSGSGSEHHAIYLQLMMAAQQMGKLENGWHLYPRLHIWLRQYWQADSDETRWLAMRNKLGFDSYGFNELADISRNDWLLISLSEITQLDLVNWFNLYGFSTNQKARDQVASKDYDSLGDVFYSADGSDFCRTLQHQELPLDGNSSWPDSAD
ncbi:ImpA family metalloprotease [Bacterioplanoides pacificum]|uniref:ImpA family metalloprotease n=1 Tax=Bacterioplanoides pacificum TaxID=1171596 RepID=A0ABV7VUI3_9GAMM